MNFKIGLVAFILFLGLLLTGCWLYQDHMQKLELVKAEMFNQQEKFKLDILNLKKVHEAKLKAMRDLHNEEVVDLQDQINQVLDQQRQMYNLRSLTGLTVNAEEMAAASKMAIQKESVQALGNKSVDKLEKAKQKAELPKQTQNSSPTRDEILKALRETPEAKGETSALVDHHMKEFWDEFATNMDPVMRDDILGMIRNVSEEIFSISTSMWNLHDRDERVKLTNEILEKKIAFRENLRNKFGQDALDSFKEHSARMVSRDTVDRMYFFGQQEDKKRAMVEILVEVKKQNDWDDGLVYEQMSTMNEAQLADYQLRSKKMMSEMIDRSVNYLSEQEKQNFQKELENQNRWQNNSW